ncbi:MAG: glutathione S-transferase family protein [Paracoccaceae bacterium]|nr:glutathione S-transferase family protein [Paracoccaceae bacterium]MDH5531003.1 glutathione S-transferase family protein [Paracoccaceae bacterium]
MYILHYAPDNASLIVRMVLEEMGQPYRTALVDRSTQQQDSAEYRRVNPTGLIPAIVTPRGAIFETAAILLWLSEEHKHLAPQPGAPDRAAFLAWLFFTSNTLHSAARNLFYPEKYAGEPAAESVFAAKTRERVTGHLTLIDRMMQSDRPDWLRADQPSVLSYYVACLIRWVQLYPQKDAGWFDLRTLPALHALCQDLQSRPAALTAANAEGLGPTIFTRPIYADPPEGSAL